LTPFPGDGLALLASLVSEVLGFVFHHSSEFGFVPLYHLARLGALDTLQLTGDGAEVYKASTLLRYDLFSLFPDLTLFGLLL